MTVRIAILGGGIGGLATAAFLRRAGLACTVYEQAAALTQVGAGLLVTPNAARLLRRLGVFDGLREHALRLDVGWEFRRWRDGTVLSWEDLSTACADMYGEHTWTIHRADLLRALLPQVERVELGRRCVAVDGGRLRFADGHTVEADVVVGADGLHSIVRAALFGDTPATFSGLCAFRALVPADVAPDFARRPAQTLWLGPGRHLVHYPVAAGRLVNLVGVAPAGDYTVESWTATATVAELRAEFDGWDPRLTGLIESAATLGRWALLDRPPLPGWSRGGTTLLGDAAHPMFPFYAQGAAQAIEDAAVLARCLAEHDDPRAALREYEELRIPRTTRLQQVSRARSESNHLPDGPAQRERDATFAQRDPLVANGWIYGYDPEAP
ncbi:FAD-dependent monooxygenase [Actinoplanes sp. CA-252034]|uniref:FAD-dependent monooxygenase n=1 Tax=Actinoplanes sp. CA-252034 TaxID=3239906 RepID=UPI003D9682DB